MRVEVLANTIEPGDQVWFPNTRKPQAVLEVEDRQGGAQRQVVLTGESGVIWHMFYDTSTVNKWVPDEPLPNPDEGKYLDPEGNPA